MGFKKKTFLYSRRDVSHVQLRNSHPSRAREMNAHTDREEGNCGRGTIPTFHVKFEKEKNKLLIFQIGMTEPVRKKQNFARMTDKREPLYLYYTFRHIYISYFSSAYLYSNVSGLISSV